MNKTTIKGLAVAAAAIATSPASAVVLDPTSIVLDGGFEVQGAAATNDHCYFGFAANGNAACSPTTPWNGADGAGLQIESNTIWPGSPSPDGKYYAFIQGGSAVLSQTIFIAQAGNYVINWLAAGRNRGAPNDGNQSYSVSLTQGFVAEAFAAALAAPTSVEFTGYTTTTSQPFHTETTGAFALDAGSYTLSFNGLTEGDHTAFIDAVSISAAPEPATWGLMILGFGIAGAFLRRKRPARPALA